jgi:hypothetical protein
MGNLSGEKLRLIRWANDGYPPINLSEEFSAVIDLIKEVRRLRLIVSDKSIASINNYDDLKVENTYWVNYEGKWQPTKAIRPYEPENSIHFRFLNGMIIECYRIKIEHIKPLIYYDENI